MYEIYKLNEDLYQIHSSFANEKAMEGTLAAIIVYASTALGFDIDELEYAFLNMIENDTDSAHFGVNRTFIYSFNKKEKYGKVS